MNKVANYIANLGKSVAYSAIDEFKATNPTISSFIDTNKDIVRATTSYIKNIRTSMRSTGKAISASKIYKAAEEGKRALFEDLKTGKFYNKERQDEFDMKAMGDMGVSDDFDDSSFDFDEKSFDFEDNTESASTATVRIEKSLRQSAEATTMAIARTGEFISDGNRASATLLSSQITKLGADLNTELSSINSGINNILSFATSTVQTHAQNSKTFYESTSKELQTQTAILKELLDMQRNMYKKETKSSKSPNRIDDVIGARCIRFSKLW